MSDFCQTTEFTDPPTIQEIERQVRWEVAAVDLAVKRFRREQLGKAGAETSAGQRLIQQAMEEFTSYLQDMQEALRDQMVQVGLKPEWWNYVGLLAPEKLAYLTLRALIGERPAAGVIGGRKVSQSALVLVSSIQTEVAFQDWVAEDRRNAQEARELGVAYQRQFEALKRRVKKVDNRAFKRWMARLKRAWKQPWPKEQKVLLGAALIEWCVSHSVGLFERELAPRPGGKTELYVVLTDRAKRIIADHNARAEVAQPLRRPMLCRPKQWQWETAGCTQADTTSLGKISSAVG